MERETWKAREQRESAEWWAAVVAELDEIIGMVENELARVGELEDA